MCYKIINDDCLNVLENCSISENIDLTFLDPPFNQQKEYAYHDDNMSEKDYWNMMTRICESVFRLTEKGGAVYFMQREKNAEFVLKSLRESGWRLQNLILPEIWGDDLERVSYIRSHEALSLFENSLYYSVRNE